MIFAPEHREALELLVRQDLARRRLIDFCALTDPTYERARHLDLLASHLEALERRDINKLIVCMPPRHGKSKTACQDFPAWYLGRNAKNQVILASYGAELAEGHSRKVRELVSHELYPFRNTRVNANSSAVDRWETTSGGIVRAAGVGGALTGLGADLLVIDDAVKDAAGAESETIRESTWAWYSTVARTRLMPRAVRVVIGTRWHEDDLLGRILDSPGASEWTTLILPALAEPGDPLGREPGEALWPAWYPADKLPSVASGELSTRQFVALYQQRPAPAEGALFKAEWFTHFFDGEPPTHCVAGQEPWNVRLQAIDTAAKTGVSNDFSVIATVQTDGVNCYVLDVVRKRVEFPDLVRLVVEQARKHRPHGGIYIEDSSAGTAVIQKLRVESNLPVIPVKVAALSKVARAEAQTAHFEAGKIWFPRHAPWYGDLVDEMIRFPYGRHDDQTDALCMAVAQATIAIGAARRRATMPRHWMAR
jgi:predicted phage terminase large subunit-like protein